MPHSFGVRARTRQMFSRDFRKKGVIPLTTYMTTYKVGDIVDIKANAAIHKGMPHKYYHGKTGVVYNVSKVALGIICYKVVGNRYMEKRVNIRVEHVKPSKCRLEFLQRVKDNEKAKADARKAGLPLPNLKRLAAQPRAAHVLSAEGAGAPQTIYPVPYETLV
ncbi:hypothetical protein CXG81DRAFT_23576 [Caulochytrium protostelioides]|uniref:60S ribosomal protein L21-A n=1 Tax=Caulochytrium protostelioides TaxID=1555241 RepID=A0A4P9XEZ1_9FUNG|nr:hypothetical protein CXG81DRAFT_23576 [Caulochytrium protostelioides]|eukprot:RKP03741.1 hypothetical protein CXG81DRAFT_23576 [Caulochytrium protostelioides]